MAYVSKFLKPRICLRTFKKNCSFLGRFCNKTPEKEEDGICKTIQLENAFKLYNLKNEPESSVTLTKNDAIKMFKKMQTIREIERTFAALYRQKLIRGFCHLYLGQEACAVGIHSAMRKVDSICGGYRVHGWYLLMGNSMHDLVAEMCQKKTGSSRGKGGSMHSYGRDFYGGNGIVGSQVPLGTGVALAHSYKCDGGVCLAVYGDGGANQGQVFEAFNISYLFKLPVVYVCENNIYGMGTHAHRAAAQPEYYKRGNYVPGLWVNGMDVLAVRSATEFAINHVMSYGPLVMELYTYRYEGHSMSDPGTSYRSRDEINEVRKQRDPLMLFEKLCTKECLLTEEEIKKMKEEIKKEVNDVVEQVKKEQEPGIDELTSDVYVKCYEKNIRGTTQRNMKHTNVGQLLNPLGTPKATPISEIKEPKKEEPNKEEPKKEEAKKEEANKEETKKEEAKPPAAEKPPEKPPQNPPQKAPEEQPPTTPPTNKKK